MIRPKPAELQFRENDASPGKSESGIKKRKPKEENREKSAQKEKTQLYRTL